jgi:hypothetical protein
MDATASVRCTSTFSSRIDYIDNRMIDLTRAYLDVRPL